MSADIDAIRKSREGLIHEISDRQFILTAAGALLFAIFIEFWSSEWILSLDIFTKLIFFVALSSMVFGFLSLLWSVNRLTEMRSIYFLIEMQYNQNKDIINKNLKAINAFKLQRLLNVIFYVNYFIGIIILTGLYFVRIFSASGPVSS